MYAKKRNSRLIFFLLLILLLIVFCVSGYFVVDYFLESMKQGSRYDNLAAIMENEATATKPPESIPSGAAGTESTEPTALTILPQYEKLYNMNDHMVGWIKIDGTDVSYPVMQTPDDKDYYLYRNFDRVQSNHGSIYVREECDLLTPSDNVIIYGHRMKDGSMFEDLTKFERKKFWQEYPEIQFDTLYEEHTYQVFAVFKTTASVGQGFEYHNFIDAATEEDFDWFVRKCKELALYDTGITPEYGDKLICLSTCEYSQVNGRLVIAAVRTK